MKFKYGIHPAIAGPGAIGNSCCRLSDIEAQARRWGWSGHFRQVQSGDLRLDATRSVTPTATIMNFSMSRRLEILSRTRSDIVAIIMPSRLTTMLVNDHKVGPGDVLVLPPKTAIAAWTSSAANFMALCLPVSTLPTSHFLEVRERMRLKAGQSSLILSESEFATYLHARTTALLERHYETEEKSFQANKPCCLDNSRWIDSRNSLTEAQDVRILQQSIEYIEDNLAAAISMSELSAAASTSLSKLERVFREKLDISPNQYLRSRRLNLARRSLALDNFGGHSVATAAFDHGFTHLGRFSGAYRQQYGELPSETLSFGNQSRTD